MLENGIEDERGGELRELGEVLSLVEPRELWSLNMREKKRNSLALDRASVGGVAVPPYSSSGGERRV